MKLATRRLIAAGVTLACCATFLWLSGLPWVRSPAMAFYWFCACICAVIVAFVGVGSRR
ncbi:MAG TPA: hypothetical protein VN731_10210 [Rhodanobacter sp.]|nr:hypothetical protein [Rhodanobacter sp.]